MISIKELADTLKDAVDTENNYLALKREYNKITRVLQSILKDHSGVISDEDWLSINSSEERVNYSFSVNDDDNVVIQSHPEYKHV